VRQARLDARLTLAQVAGSDVSRQAIHLVETGKARPSAAVLELIAQRTGRPLSSFLRRKLDDATGSTSIQVKELEWLCLDRRYDEAAAAATNLLKEALSLRAEAETTFYLGQALVQLSRPAEALPHLEAACAGADRLLDPWLAVECLDWQAGALYVMEDPRALAVAEDALRRCRELSPALPRTEARILEHIASIHVRNHTTDTAIEYYEAAIEAAGSVRDLSRLARTYHGLSIAFQERGQLGRAAEFAHKALGLYALEEDHVLTGRAENELGLLLMRQGEMARAEALFLSALAHFDAAKSERVRSHVLLSLGELYLLTGDLPRSAEYVDAALVLAERLSESLALATGHHLRGHLHERLGSGDEADREFKAGLALLQRLGATDRLARAHAEYAQVLESRGNHEQASRQWRLAAELALPRLRPGKAQTG
jgi:tetratricopeptide (TPR) repeat protein